MKTNTYSTIMADTMNGEYALSAELPLFTAASDTIWSRDVQPGGSLLVRTRDEIVLDLNRQIPGVKNILPDMLEIALDNIGDYNLSTLKAVLEFDRRRSMPINVTKAGGRLLRLDLSGTGLTEEERALTGNRRIRIQLKNGSMVCSNLKVCCDSKGRPLGHLRGRLQSAPEPVTEYCCQSDNNKNITSLTDDAGAICAAWEYDAYGNIVNQTGEKLDVSPLRFSSEYHDEELGLVYYNYRHYNPKEGRWISRDPIGEINVANLYGINISLLNFFDYLGLLSLAFDESVQYEGDELGKLKVGGELNCGETQSIYEPSDITKGIPFFHGEDISIVSEYDAEVKGQEKWKVVERDGDGFSKHRLTYVKSGVITVRRKNRVGKFAMGMAVAGLAVTVAAFAFTGPIFGLAALVIVGLPSAISAFAKKDKEKLTMKFMLEITVDCVCTMDEFLPARWLPGGIVKKVFYYELESIEDV